MESIKIVGIILGSSVFAALVTAFFTKKSHEETIALKYITEERAKWREKIKELMVELSEAVNSPLLNDERTNKTRKVSTYLKLSLNPNPKHILDKEILEYIDELCKNPSYNKFTILEKKVSLLLKHDWERAKNEAKASISSLLMIALLILITWSVFYLILRKTAIYSFIQSLPPFSGLYSEVAFSIGAIALVAHILLVAPKQFREFCNDRKRKKLNEKLPPQSAEP